MDRVLAAQRRDLPPLFAAISIAGLGRRRLRRLSAPLWLWFVVPNLVAFHPSEWNNTKFFIFWQWAGAVAVADLLAGLLVCAGRRHPAAHGRRADAGPTDAGRADPSVDGTYGARSDTRLAGVGAPALGSASSRLPSLAARPRSLAVGLGLAATLAVAALVVTGALDTLRAMQRSSAIEHVEHDDLAAASWLRDNHRPHDVLVYGATNTSAIMRSAACRRSPRLRRLDVRSRPSRRSIAARHARSLSGETVDAGDGTATLSLVARYGATLVAIGPRVSVPKRVLPTSSGSNTERWCSNAGSTGSTGSATSRRRMPVPPVGQGAA